LDPSGYIMMIAQKDIPQDEQQHDMEFFLKEKKNLAKDCSSNKIIIE